MVLGRERNILGRRRIPTRLNKGKKKKGFFSHFLVKKGGRRSVLASVARTLFTERGEG